MKTCLNCGKIIEDDKIQYCPNCGNGLNGHTNGSMTAAFILMILSCIAWCWTIIPLLWLIPMAVIINKRMKSSSAPLSTGFKICVLIFGNLISGILLLCDSEA